MDIDLSDDLSSIKKLERLKELITSIVQNIEVDSAAAALSSSALELVKNDGKEFIGLQCREISFEMLW